MTVLKKLYSIELDDLTAPHGVEIIDFLEASSSPLPLDGRGRTGSVRREVSKVWFHRVTQLLPHDGHVSFRVSLHMISIRPSFVALIHGNTGIGCLLRHGMVRRSRCLQSLSGVIRTLVSSPLESNTKSRAELSSSVFQTLRLPSLKVTTTSSKSRLKG